MNGVTKTPFCLPLFVLLRSTFLPALKSYLAFARTDARLTVRSSPKLDLGTEDVPEQGDKERS